MMSSNLSVVFSPLRIARIVSRNGSACCLRELMPSSSGVPPTLAVICSCGPEMLTVMFSPSAAKKSLSACSWPSILMTYWRAAPSLRASEALRSTIAMVSKVIVRSDSRRAVRSFSIGSEATITSFCSGVKSNVTVMSADADAPAIASVQSVNNVFFISD